MDNYYCGVHQKLFIQNRIDYQMKSGGINQNMDKNGQTVQKRAGFIVPEPQADNSVQFSSNYKSEQIEQLKEIYRMYDKANVGYINDTALKFLLRGFGDNVNEVELMNKLEDMDEDGNGVVDFQEFANYMMEKANQQSLKGDITEVFKCLDPYGLGKMDYLTMKVNCLGKVNNQTLQNFMWFADEDNEGEFEYVKFLDNLFDDGNKSKASLRILTTKK